MQRTLGNEKNQSDEGSESNNLWHAFNLLFFFISLIFIKILSHWQLDFRWYVSNIGACILFYYIG